ncbi:hypothetical protein UVI_02007840 [Ustilaginoidea virens]|uniref:Uncharacterized protein n=1 Tax=Ustilaginoidea virens TaxID=1159556 RepID=A0A1B5KVC7_USTVR|nr:hypothetical protein UVI_02007840 [Ustilaginoidea virens]
MGAPRGKARRDAQAPTGGFAEISELRRGCQSDLWYVLLAFDRQGG